VHTETLAGIGAYKVNQDDIAYKWSFEGCPLLL